MLIISARQRIIVLAITAITAGMIIGTTGATGQSADGEIAVSPADVSVEQDDTQTIVITYQRISTATPQGIEYTLSYDPDVISVVNQEQGSYLSGDAFENSIETPGKIEYGEVLVEEDGVETVNGTVTRITIEPSSNATGAETTDVEFTTARASEAGTELIVTTTNGTIGINIPEQVDEGTSDDSQNADDNTSDDSQNADEKNTNTSNSKSGSTDDNQSGTVGNDQDNIKTRDRANTEQTDDTNATDSGTATETDTSESVPGFGILTAVLSVLAFNYTIRRKRTD
jgi:hypothetical protein